jgi:rubredoxin
MIHIPEPPEMDVCPDEFKCPHCGENRHDELVWDDNDWLHCATCGHVYDPSDPLPTASRN